MKNPIILLLFLSVGASAQEPATRWIVHYTSEEGGFQTGLDLINSDFSASHPVRLLPYAQDGTLLESAIQVREIAAGARLTLDRASLEWTGMPVSHVAMEAVEEVRTAAHYRAKIEGAMEARVSAQSEAGTQVRLVPFEGDGWFDGVVAFNPNPEAVSLTLTAHDTHGNTLRTTQVNVPAMGKWLSAVDLIFDEQTQIDGYLEMRSEQEIMFLALRGSNGEQLAPVLTQVGLDHFAGTPAEVSYNNQISRIVNRECSTCHKQGGIGPFSLVAFEHLETYGTWMTDVIESGQMPPWKASLDCRELVDPQVLDPAEKQILLDWLSSDRLQGDAARAPQPPEPQSSEWQLGQPDYLLQYGEPYYFEAGDDVYRCFPIKLNNTEEIQISAIEVLPDNPEIVHHVLLFLANDKGVPARDLDSQEDGPGYTCFGGPGDGGFRVIAGWAPGQIPQVMPDDVGMTIPADATLIMQVHYHYSTNPGHDQTKIGIHQSQTQRSKELQLLPLVNQNFVIPAGKKDHLVEMSVTLPFSFWLDLYTIAPHMHLLGKDISVEARYPDGSEECLVHVPDWDFNWQRFYTYEEPLHLPQLTTLTLRCTFDNSAENPFNPNSPPLNVGWGEETTDEMALAFIGVVAPFQLLEAEGKKAGPWQWPFTLAGTHPSRDLNPGVDVKAHRKPAIPSCCLPGGEKKPWQSCPNKPVTLETDRTPK